MKHSTLILNASFPLQCWGINVWKVSVSNTFLITLRRFELSAPSQDASMRRRCGKKKKKPPSPLVRWARFDVALKCFLLLAAHWYGKRRKMNVSALDVWHSHPLRVCPGGATARAAVWAVKVRHLVANCSMSACVALILVNLEVLYWSQWGSCPLSRHPAGARGSGLITGRPPWS